MLLVASNKEFSLSGDRTFEDAVIVIFGRNQGEPLGRRNQVRYAPYDAQSGLGLALGEAEFVV